MARSAFDGRSVSAARASRAWPAGPMGRAALPRRKHDESRWARTGGREEWTQRKLRCKRRSFGNFKAFSARARGCSARGKPTSRVRKSGLGTRDARHPDAPGELAPLRVDWFCSATFPGSPAQFTRQSGPLCSCGPPWVPEGEHDDGSETNEGDWHCVSVHRGCVVGGAIEDGFFGFTIQRRH